MKITEKYSSPEFEIIKYLDGDELLNSNTTPTDDDEGYGPVIKP